MVSKPFRIADLIPKVENLAERYGEANKVS